MGAGIETIFDIEKVEERDKETDGTVEEPLLDK